MGDSRLLKKILLSLLLLSVSVLAQQETEQVLIIDKLKGLNTRAGTFMLQPNELVWAYNIDYGEVGVYKKRKGYDSVSVLNGMDSIVDGGIFTVAYNDGTQQLVIVADSDGVGYGAVYLSPLGSANIEDSATKIWDYFSVQNKPSFEQYLDRVYIGNGSHRPIMYDKNSGLARQVPPRASGEPLIVPLNTAGNLNGEYVYRMRVELTPDLNAAGYDFARIGWHGGFLSGRIKVANGRCLLTYFPSPISVRSHLGTGSDLFAWRVAFCVDIVTVENSTDYWLFVNDDSVGYTSDASATRMEIAVNLSNGINAAVGDTVDSHVLLDDDHGYFIYMYSDADSVGYACSTTMPIDTMDIDGDSTWILMIERTKANPVILDESDSVVTVKWQEFFYTGLTSNEIHFDTFQWIDNVSDAGNYVDELLGREFIGRDSLNNVTYRYGSPAFVSTIREVLDTSAYGIYGGWPLSQDEALGVVYACTFVDTITGLESDISRLCAIWKDSTVGDDSIFVNTISLPKTAKVDSGFKVNLYRAMLTAIRGDTLWLVDTTYIEHESRYYVYDTGYGGVERHLKTEIIVERDIKRWVDGLELDSVYMGRLIFLRQFDDTVRTHVDSMRYDSLINRGTAIHDEYEQIDSPPLMRGMFSFQNRMFAYQGNRLYYSDLDNPLGGQSINDWHEWDHIVVAEGDGDEIVYAYSARDYIRVFKHSSSYIVYQTDEGFGYELDDGSFWPHIDYLGAYGCLSPQSFIDAPEGSYYLSNVGVLRENAGQQLARQRDISLVSAKLDNFDNLSISDKEDAVAAYVPHEQRYLLCIGDTTYNYDIRADAWSTWDMTFSGSALYRVESAVDNYPGDTLYFIRPGDSVLYRYGTSTKDNGTSVLMEWKTAPLLADNRKYTITSIGIWGIGMDTTVGMTVTGYNEYGVGEIATYYIPRDQRYSLSSPPPNVALYHTLYFITYADALFDRFEVYYIDQGIAKKE